MSPSDAPLELVGQAVIEAFSAIKRDSGRNPILRVSYGP
jgi:hypothetical protein